MALPWDKATFDQLYSFSGEIYGHYPGGRQKGIRLGYNYYVIGGSLATVRALRLKSNLGIPDGANVLHIGCGFGWALEAYAGIGINAVGTDTSDYVHANLNTSEEPDLRARIKAADREPDEHMIIGPPSRISDSLESFRLLDAGGKPIKEPEGQETNAEGYRIDMARLPSPWPTGKHGWLMPDRPTDALDTTTIPPDGAGWIDTPHPDGSGKHIWSAPALDVYLRERSGMSPRTDATIIQEDGGTNASRTAIGRLLGNRFDFILTENLLAALTDDEAVTVAENMQRLNERFGGQMIHLTTSFGGDERTDPMLNTKTLKEWKTLFDANGLIAHKIASRFGETVL